MTLLLDFIIGYNNLSSVVKVQLMSNIRITAIYSSSISKIFLTSWNGNLLTLDNLIVIYWSHPYDVPLYVPSIQHRVLMLTLSYKIYQMSATFYFTLFLQTSVLQIMVFVRTIFHISLTRENMMVFTLKAIDELCIELGIRDST